MDPELRLALLSHSTVLRDASLPVYIEPDDGELLESDGEVEGGEGGAGLQVVVAGQVSHHDHPAEHPHVAQHRPSKAPAHSVPEYVNLGITFFSVFCQISLFLTHSIGSGDVEGLVEVLGFVVESPVEAQVSLDPGGFLSTASIGQHP